MTCLSHMSRLMPADSSRGAFVLVRSSYPVAAAPQEVMHSTFAALMLSLLVPAVQPQEEKRAVFGGTAFAGLDRLPLNFLAKVTHVKIHLQNDKRYDWAKRSAMGGSAFGGLDRIPLSYIYSSSPDKRDRKSLYGKFARGDVMCQSATDGASSCRDKLTPPQA